MKSYGKRLAILAMLSTAALVAPASAFASGMPQSGTIVINTSVAGANLLGSQSQVNGAWGQPYSCRPRGGGQSKSCRYEQYNAGQFGSVTFNSSGNATYVEWDVTAYTTSKGIGVGSSRSALFSAYGSQLNTTACGGSNWPCILGTTNGVNTETVFFLQHGSIASIWMTTR